MKTRFAPILAAAGLLLGSATALAAEHSLDDAVRAGTTELARVDWTAHADGARALAEMNYAGLHGLVRQGISELARADWRSDLGATRVAARGR